MATPQLSGNHDPSLATQCLAFIQTLVNQKIGFNFHLTSGQFSCSFDSNRTVTAALARIPTEAKKKSSSPSTKRRNAKRRQLFLENKKRGSSYVDCEETAQNEPPQSACEKPPQAAHNEQPQPSALKEPTQPFSERLCFPSSSESADLDTTDYGGGHITKKIRMDKVPPIKVLVDAQSSPKYRIQQLDGNSSLSDLSLFDDNQPSEHGDNQPSEHDDDPKMGQSTSCPNCDQPLSISHQCQDPNQQTNIDNWHTVNCHSEATAKDKILALERKYLNNPSLPEEYKSVIISLLNATKKIWE
jgi:hypothetical protein